RPKPTFRRAWGIAYYRYGHLSPADSSFITVPGPMLACCAEAGAVSAPRRAGFSPFSRRLLPGVAGQGPHSSSVALVGHQSPVFEQVLAGVRRKKSEIE